jgi:hypothetical protein
LTQKQFFDLTLNDFQSLEPQLTQRIGIASAKVKKSYFSRTAIIVDSDDDSPEEEVEKEDQVEEGGEGEEVEEEGEGEGEGEGEPEVEGAIEEEEKVSEGADVEKAEAVVDVSNIVSGAADYGAGDYARTYFRKKTME